jgi:hypothetical protein
MTNRTGNRHEFTCTECKTVCECTCDRPEKHQERRDRSWTDPCQPCNREAQEGWFRWLKTLPETSIREEVPNSGSWKS